MRRTLRSWIEDEAVTVCTMVVPVVRRLDEKRDKTTFHLVDYVDYGVSEEATGVNASFSLESNLIDSSINIVLSEVVQVRIVLGFHCLDNLTKDAVSALVINLSFVLVDQSLAPIDEDLGLSSIWNACKLLVDDLIDYCS